MVTELSQTAQIILKLIDDYGCLTLQQAADLCGGDEDNAKRQLSHLIYINAIKERDGLYGPFKNPKFDTTLIDCLWVAFDKATHENGEKDREALMSAFPNNPVQVCLIQKDKYYNIVGINETNISSTLPFLIERFDHYYSSVKNIGRQEYIFVVRDMNIISLIGEYAPKMPNKIALIEGDVLSKVKIRYLSPKND